MPSVEEVLLGHSVPSNPNWKTRGLQDAIEVAERLLEDLQSVKEKLVKGEVEPDRVEGFLDAWFEASTMLEDLPSVENLLSEE